MAHIAPTSKLPTEAEQFYFESGGYVLLRFVRHGPKTVIMTATASEDRPYVSDEILRRPKGPPLFTNADSSPIFPEMPAPAPLHMKVYPNPDRLMAAAAAEWQTLHVPLEERLDTWGRRYVSVYGAFEDARIRSAANAVAKALGLEPSHEPWTAEEEMQELYQDLAIGDDGEDVYLSDGVYLTADGQLRG